MSYYRCVGKIPKTRHTQFRQPSGAIYHEEMLTTAGFDGLSSLLYHVSPPTIVQSIKAQPPVRVEAHNDDVLRHHRFQTLGLQRAGDFLTARTPLFFNDDVVLSLCTPERPSEAFYRNGECDELVYVHEGTGEMLTPFGSLAYRANDWVYIPRGTTVEWVPKAGGERLFVIESVTDIRPPSRYLNQFGQFLEASPYCERDMRGPEYREPVEGSGSFEVRVKARDLVTSFWLEHHPFDVVGWDGCFYPYAINAFDFQPIVQSIHTMPNVHQIFATGNAAICNLIPRPADFHPDAIVAAPNHASVDCDEVLYILGGKLAGRVGDGPGTTTFHPRGIPHGPKPGMYEKSIGNTRHEGLALMVDTFRTLKIAAPAMECDDPTYPSAWTGG